MVSKTWQEHKNCVDRVVGYVRLWQGQTALQSDYWQTAEGSTCRYHASNRTLQHMRRILPLQLATRLCKGKARLLLQHY
jgi:hypothetical protein